MNPTLARLCCALLLAPLAGCFSSSLPPIPCTSSGGCLTGQSCDGATKTCVPSAASPCSVSELLCGGVCVQAASCAQCSAAQPCGDGLTCAASGFCVAAAAPASIASQSGSGQSGAAGSALGSALVVKVLDSKGNPAKGVSISWAAATGGGSVTPATSSTGADGTASTSATLGAQAASNTFTASAAGLTGSPVTFAATARAGPAAKLSRSSGNAQSGIAGSLLAQPLVVIVTDAFDNPVAGEPVTWAASAGGGHVTAGSTSGADGLAQTTATLGNAAGANAFTASATGLAGSPVSFSATGVVGAPSKLTAVTATGQQLTVGSKFTLTVLVADANSNPIPGAVISWAASAGGGLVSPTSSTSGLDGKASTQATLGLTAGSNTFSASVSGVQALSVPETGVAGPAAKLVAVTASGQSVVAGSALNLQVRITDANDNPVAGTTVTWAAGSGGGAVLPLQSASGADGLTSTAATLGGAVGLNSFTATAAGLAGSPATFTETGVAGPFAKLARVSLPVGNVQVGGTQTLIVRATDANDNPLSGVQVGWTATSGGGGIAPSSGSTAADGTVSATATLGLTAGANTFTASSGAVSAVFTRTGTAGPAAALTAVTAGGLSAVAGGTLVLAAKVADASGNPVQGTTVTWAATGGGGSVSQASGLTAADGTASVTATLGALVGSNTFTASAAGLSGSPLAFTVTGTVGPPKQLTLTSGSGQSALANGPLPAPLVVRVADANGNPVQGVPVSWAAVTGGGSVAAASSTTAANGSAQIGASLGAPGAATFSASVAGLTTLTFTATGTVGPPASLTRVAADNQSAQCGSTVSLSIKVADANGNAVQGATVAWAAATGGGSVSPASVAAAADGTAGTTATLGALAGSNTFTATVSGAANSPLVFTATGLVGPPVKLAKDAAADNQTAVAGATLVLRAKVTDATGNPVAGVSVGWSRTGGNGSITPSASTSAADGYASATAKLGNAAGANTYSANFTGNTSGAQVFSESGTPDVPSSITLVSGDAQSGTAGAALASPLTVQVTDALGNLVSGVTVLWSVAGGGGKVSPASSQTAADGTATTTATTGNAAGPNSFSGRVTGLTPVPFGATGLAGPASKLVQDISTEGQTAVAGGTVPLRVSVTDLNGNPVQGVNVTWSTLTGGGSVTPPSSATNSSGVASATATLGPSLGANTYKAAVNGLTPSSITFTENGASGTAGKLVADASTSGKTVVAGGTTLLRVTVTDSNNNPVQGTSVSWSGIAGGGSVAPASSNTAADGTATTTATLGVLAGGNTFRATSAGLVGSPSDFTETGIAGAAATVVVKTGSGQTGTAGALLGQTLVALVSDSHGNPVGGASVTFAAATGGGSVSPATVTTQPDGTASTFATLGAVAGSNSFTATVTGLTAATFGATGIAGAAAKLVQDATTNGQTATAGAAVTLRVKITDANNNVVQGTQVSWAATAGGGSVSSPTSLSGADGNATTGATLGVVAGGNTFTASAAGLAPASVTFSATGTAGPAVNLAKVAASDGQSGTTGSTLVLKAKVTDVNGNAVQGKSVTWAAATGGGSVAPGASSTDALGVAQTTATLGTISGSNTFTATGAGLSPGTVTFTATGIAGSPVSLAKVTADGSGTVGAAVTLVAKVLDGSGNPVPGITVNWSATTGGGRVQAATSSSQADGTATMTAFLGGIAGANAFQAAATTSGGAALSGSPVTFTQTGLAGPATTLTKLTPDNNVPTVGTTMQLKAQVADNNGNGVSGATVNWATSTPGSSVSPASCNTVSDGTCTTTATIGTTAGVKTFTAASTGLTTVTFTQTALAGPANKVVVFSGNNQSGVAGAALAQALVAQVQDQYGNGVQGFTVNWAPPTGGGTVAPVTTVSAADGTVSVTATLNKTAGAHTFTANIALSPGSSTATFSATATAGPAVTLSQDATTNGQSATVNTAVTLRVSVTDANGNPVPGFGVGWSVTSGGGKFPGNVTAQTVNTAADGTSVIPATLGTTAGANTFSAAGAGLSPASLTFAATGTAGPVTQVNKTGDSQSATVGSSISLTIRALDAFGNVVGAVPVSWTVLSGGGSLGAGASGATDASGRQQLTFTLGTTAGANSVQASCGGLTPTFTATGLAGPALNLVRVTADGSATAGSALTVTAKVTDSFGNPVAAWPVNWLKTGGTGSVSNPTTVNTLADGKSSVTATLGTTVGGNTFQASGSKADSTTLLGSPLAFTFTGTAGPAAKLAKVTSDNQSPVAGSTFSLQARVTDTNLNPVAGTQLTWSVTAGGGNTVSNVCTSVADGTCLINVNLAPLVGLNTFSATGTGLVPVSVTFSQTTIAGPAKNLTKVAVSDGQTQTVAKSVTLTAKVTDQSGNAVSGTSVAWAAAGGPGGLSGTVTTPCTSAADGSCSATATLGNIVGTYGFQANASGLTGTPLSFTAIAVADAASSMFRTSADGNTLAVGSKTTLSVIVQDRFANGVAGTTISWAATAGGGSVAPLSSITDASGAAQTQATIGPVGGANSFSATAPAPLGAVAFNFTGMSPPAFSASMTVTPNVFIDNTLPPLSFSLPSATNTPSGDSLVYSGGGSAGVVAQKLSGGPITLADLGTTVVIGAPGAVAGGSNLFTYSLTASNAAGTSAPSTATVQQLRQSTPLGAIVQRVGATATLLPNGKVLIAGGGTKSSQGLCVLAAGVSRSAELYDPTTGVSTQIGSMVIERCQHSAVLVGTLVYLFGGTSGVTSIDIYDSAAGTFQASGLPSALNNRIAGTATLLGATSGANAGMIVLAGGYTSSGSNTLAALELFNPGTGSSAPYTSQLLNGTGRADHTATLLGKWLVFIGGWSGPFAGGSPTSVVEELDTGLPPGSGPATLQNQSAAGGRGGHSSALLTNGTDILTLGGYSGSSRVPVNLVRVHRFDPSTGQLTVPNFASGTMTSSRGHFALLATRQANKFAAVGGFNSYGGARDQPFAAAELIDASQTGILTTVAYPPSLLQPRGMMPALNLNLAGASNFAFLFAGGDQTNGSGTALAGSVEILIDP